MVEYIERDKAVKLIFLAADTGRAAKALSLLGKESVADVVEVVRCRDCKDFRPWGGQSKLGDCMVCVCDGENPFTMEETDFCSDGDRKDDQQCK